MSSKDAKKFPQHIAIIMDGNGRWAKSKGLPRVAGHKKGGEVLTDIVRYAGELGLAHLTVYAFSTENWRRPKAEVSALFKLLVDYCNDRVAELIESGTSLKFLGDIDGMPPLQREAMRTAERKTAGGKGLKFNICINYGGRQEIVNAIKSIIEDDLAAVDIDVDTVARYLYTADMPDPDLIIRTSGEQRLSNFLPWQSAYSEFVFVECHWPDFSRALLDNCIAVYCGRERRFGGV